ncbi:hypothetical protein CAEBREN_00804 [Caenorhabditis brenneri]|uniref:E3 ubiquitin-protein transferase MAEA n=1 Tax=Caenorhabditis brenneri TaxID=135651 RepID=G0MJ04_CAEBE|nr:hypothetical protein CAEBREN_00804 [Caenorhabditis brenneri]
MTAPEPPRTVPPFPFRGTTVGGKDSKKQTDVLSLDYCTFRTPYEECNVLYRNSQKSLERNAILTSKIAALIKRKVNNSTEPIAQNVLKKHFDYLIQQVQEQKAEMQKSLDTTVAFCQKIQYRCDKLAEEFPTESDEETEDEDIKMEVEEQEEEAGPSTSTARPPPKRPPAKETDEEKWERTERNKFARYIAWHMLRCGFIEPAKELIKTANLQGMVDVEVFQRIFAIEQALHQRNTQPCIEWCNLHRSKLRRIGSRMEIVARTQDVITFIEEGNIPEAVAYVKKNLTPIAKDKFQGDLTKVMSAIFIPLEESKTRNPEYHTPLRYEETAKMFIKEAYRLYGLGGMDAFETLVQMGLASMKTPECHADRKTPKKKQKCIVCRPDIFPLAKDLPFAHVENSIILCSMNGSVCDDEHNIPFLFPSGHVFGKKAVNKLRRKNGKIWDPVHKQEIEEDEVLRLYFL